MNILILDDDVKFHALIQNILTAAGGKAYHFISHIRYDDAMRTALTQPLDLMLVDYRLNDPHERTGIHFLHDLRRQHVETPAILLTSQGGREVDLRAMQEGFMDYLDKLNITPDMLERSVRYTVEQARVLNDLRHLYEQVSHLEHLKTDMIRIASHDFGNRVTTLMMSFELLIKSLDVDFSDRQMKHINGIESVLQEMRRLANDILSLERIETMLYDNALDTVDLREIVSTICDHAANRAVQTVTTTLPEHPLYVNGDSTQLNEAVHNLVENAIKYTPANGEISVRLYPASECAVLEVEDQGIGIPEHQQERLFQPFYRVKSQENQHINGTGLGLYIVKSVVERHNGVIWVKSRYGEGSLFGFRLPLQAE